MSASDTRRQVRRVLLITLVLNVAVATGKIILGMVTGALAITADGFHSLTDGAGNIAGLVANSIAARPPDADHPYGHRRFESMAALLIGGLLLLTAWEIIQGAIDRLQDQTLPDITPLTFAVLLATLAVNIFVSRYQIRAGQRLKSEILLADAQNTRADVFVTLSVMASTAITAVLGWAWVDIAAALVVVVLIGRAAWGIVRQTGQVLVDTAPYSPDRLRAIVAGVPGVERIVRARSRGPLDAVTIDIDVLVAPQMTADHSAAITTAIQDRLHAELDGIVEIEVHFAPRYDSPPDYKLTARACADALGLSTHEVHISQGRRGVLLEMHVEVPPGQTLIEAHEQVSQLEHDVQLVLPGVDAVVTHIEPARDQEPQKTDVALRDRARRIEGEALKLLNTHYPHIDWHNLIARPSDQGFAVTLHATLPPEMTIESAHNVAEAAEMTLRGEIPQLSRVTIHTEPFDH